MFNLRFKTFLYYISKNTTDYKLIDMVINIKSILHDICNNYNLNNFNRLNIHNRYNVLLNNLVELIKDNKDNDNGDIYTILYNHLKIYNKITSYFIQSSYNPNIVSDMLSSMIDPYNYEQFIHTKYKNNTIILPEFKYAIVNEFKNNINPIYTPALNNIDTMELYSIIDRAVIAKVTSMIDINYIISNIYEPLLNELVKQVTPLLNEEKIKTEIYQTMNTIINNYIESYDVEYKEYITNNITTIINNICQDKLYSQEVDNTINDIINDVVYKNINDKLADKDHLEELEKAEIALSYKAILSNEKLQTMFNNYIISQKPTIYDVMHNAIFKKIEKNFSEIKESINDNTSKTNKSIKDIDNINSKLIDLDKKYNLDLSDLYESVSKLELKIEDWNKKMIALSNQVGGLSKSINKISISDDVLNKLKLITKTDKVETVDQIITEIINSITVLSAKEAETQKKIRIDAERNINENKIVINEIESLQNKHRKIIEQLNECKHSLVSDAISDVDFHSSFVYAIDNELYLRIQNMIDDINKDINNSNTSIADKLHKIDNIRNIIKSYIIDKIKYVQTVPEIVSKLTIDINSKIHDIQSENNKLSEQVNKNSEIINDLKLNLDNITTSYTEIKDEYKNYFDKNKLLSIINQYRHTQSDISTLQENVNKLLIKYNADIINTSNNYNYPIAAGNILSLSPIYSILTYDHLEPIYVPKDLFYNPIHFGKYSSYMYAFELPSSDMEIDVCDLSKITKSIGRFPKHSIISSRPHISKLANVASKLPEYYDYCIRLFYIRNILADLYSRGDVSGILYWTNQRFLYNNQFIRSLINNLDMFDLSLLI